MSVFRWVFLCVLLALPGAAQSLAFEVVSIKPDNTQDFRNMRMKVLPARPFLGDRPARANAAGLRLQPADESVGTPVGRPGLGQSRTVRYRGEAPGWGVPGGTRNAPFCDEFVTFCT